MQICAIRPTFEPHLLQPCRRVHPKRIHDECLIERLECRCCCCEHLECRCCCCAPICVCGASNCFCCLPPGIDLVLPQPPRPPFSLSLTAQYAQNSASVQRFMMGELQLALLLRHRMEWSRLYHAAPAGVRLDLRV